MTTAPEKAEPHSFDVVVIGAGPGGYVAAIRASQLGKKVAVVEEKYWGGVCLNVGCIPTKALLRNAELAYIFNCHAATFGIFGDVTFNYGAAHKRSREVSDGRVKGVHYLMRKNDVTELQGRATFVTGNAVSVDTADGPLTVSFDNAIIATGASASVPPGIELSKNVITYEKQLLDPQLPESIAIVGAGAIGMEFGYVLANYGVAVTIVEFQDRPLPSEDADVSAEITRAYRRLDIELLLNTRVESVKDEGHRVEVTWAGATGTTSRAFDRVLVATGFDPNTAGLGLENAKVEVDTRGAITVDERMRTSAPNIYAIGDVTMLKQLAHVAEAMGVVAAETLAGAVTMELGDYQMMPRATFCQPQIASFGLTEAQARDEHVDIKVAKFPFTANGKAHGIGEATGFVKLIADNTGALLGGHIIGPDASELLSELTLAHKWDLGTFELARNVHVHPTLGEAVQEAIHGLEGHMINL